MSKQKLCAVCMNAEQCCATEPRPAGWDKDEVGDGGGVGGRQRSPHEEPGTGDTLGIHAGRAVSGQWYSCMRENTTLLHLRTFCYCREYWHFLWEKQFLLKKKIVNTCKGKENLISKTVIKIPTVQNILIEKPLTTLLELMKNACTFFIDSST